jgi:transposase
MTAADEDTAIIVDVVPGQEHDAPHLPAMLDQTAARVPDMEQVVGDKGFDGTPQREACTERGATPVIPYKVNAKKPGRLNKRAYRERNMIERLFGKLKEFRRVATRYEKLKETFLGMIHLALGFIRLKATNVNTA